MEVALVALAYYDPARAVCTGSAAAQDIFSNVGFRVMTILQTHVRPGAIREVLGEDLHSAIAALVTVFGSALRNRLPGLRSSIATQQPALALARSSM
jgi:hypothetical protein